MSPSVEDNPTLSPNGTSEPNPHDQVQSNHHATVTSSPSPPVAEVRGKRIPPRRASIDRDAQELVISSLRTQVQDLVSQVTELNNKLVKSYDRVSDLEDNIHVTSSALRSSSVKVSQLELERSQHLSALNTGLLVEKSHVTAELTRLMEKATDEAAKRGQAESARADIEKDLDDVSAALFDQANTMVAEARLGRAQSDRKAEEAERALAEAEEAVKLMQQELQALQEEKEAAERSMEDMRAAMGKGKWVERASSLPANVHHLLTSHVSYQEFLSLISYLRTVRATNPQPPAMGSLLGLPFIARLQTEDTDPTVRLDVATALNWLSRRSIMTAIQNGQLTIEPIATQTILASAVAPQPPLAVAVVHGSTNANLLCCGLCGQGIVPRSEPSPTRTGYLSRANGTQFNTWSSSIFKKSPMTSSSSAPPSPPPYHDTSSLPAQLYIFRLSDSPAFPSALPLCVSGWCLARLRTTCTLWSFLRTNILEKIWEEAVQSLPVPPRREIEGATTDKPPVPPRRKTKNSGFWGVASSIGLDRVPGWGENDKDKRTESEPEKRRFVAPPLLANSPGPSSLGPPPPLPSRNRSRPHTPAPVPVDNGAEGRRSSVTNSSARGSQSSASDRRDLPVTERQEVSPTLSGLLVSSPGDIEPSNECFLTPFEDITTPEMASEPPASVPEPGSSYNTPAATPVPLPEETNETANEPEAPHPESKPAEPAVVQSASSNSEYVEPRPQTPPAANAGRSEPLSPPLSPPSRTGSPNAPPLPRRAAARRRVPPPPVVKQPNGHHAEETEARAEPDAKVEIPSPAPETDPWSEERDGRRRTTDVLPAAEPTVVQEQETSGAEAEIVDVAGEAVEPNGYQSDGQQKPQPQPESQPEPRLSADSSTPHGDDAAMENSAEGAGITTTPNDADADAEPEKHSGLEMKMAEAAVEEKEKEQPTATPDTGKAGQPPLPPPRPPRPSVRSTERRVLSDLAPSMGRLDTGKFSATAEPVYAMDGTPYVGDATWEERTWKELTRLREDMFWARLGSAQ
ncbi:hypothetical protein BGY98DRAFT_996555 [Russula aff. rugulosa BPL654]|nr:hypothetical protein BGY98DRAFT_996555 [Russula aff. rugulosa BPL654]